MFVDLSGLTCNFFFNLKAVLMSAAEWTSCVMAPISLLTYPKCPFPFIK